MPRKNGPRMINSSKWQKYATVLITNQLKKMAKETETNVSQLVADKLKETYKRNVLASYAPRSKKGFEVEAYNQERKRLEDEDRKAGIKSPRRGRKRKTYVHTGTFLESVHVKIEDHLIKVVISNDKPYDDGKLPTDIYKYLTKGTDGGGTYAYHDSRNGGELMWAYNYPTPKHLFEEHTREQMKGFLDTLETDIKAGKYSKYKLK